MDAIIKLKDINKIYYQGKISLHILKNINLTVYKKDYIAITGASGSGKTTLMNIMGCLDRATSGTYVFDGKDITNLTDKQLSKIRAEKIGFIFQSFNLLQNYNVLENILMPTIYNRSISLKDAKIKALEIINTLGLVERIHHKPNELSGGQQQRVAIARALINNPNVILADEPTGNLDTKNSEEILKIFDELNDNGVAVIIVTHEKSISDRARRKVIIKDGEII